MKTITLFTLLAIVVSMETNAQGAQINSLKTVPNQSMSAVPSGLGSMISNFAEKISPSALTPDFLKNKKAFTEKANTTKDPKGASGLLKELQAGIKSTAFQKAWATEKPKWEAKASTIKSPKDLEEALKSLGSNLKPEALKKL